MTLDKNNEVKDSMVLAMLPHVAFDGWSEEALISGRRDLKMEAINTDLLFPRGMRDVALHFGDYIDREMTAKLATVNLNIMPVRERIATCVIVRLGLLAPHKDAIRRLLSFMALPGNHPFGLQITMKTTDVIWNVAGDTATDFNYYTKRGLLAGIYGLTILYWLSDTSPDCVKTGLFLEQRISEVMQIPKFQGKLARIFKRLG